MRNYKANKPFKDDSNETSKKTILSQLSSKSKTYSSPTKKAISKEFVETDSNESSDENKKKNSKKLAVNHQKKAAKDKSESSEKLSSDESSDKNSN